MDYLCLLILNTGQGCKKVRSSKHLHTSARVFGRWALHCDHAHRMGFCCDCNHILRSIKVQGRLSDSKE